MNSIYLHIMPKGCILSAERRFFIIIHHCVKTEGRMELLHVWNKVYLLAKQLEWLKKLSVLHWSSQSSDLDPIENLQNYLKTVVLTHHQTNLNNWSKSVGRNVPKSHLSSVQNWYMLTPKTVDSAQNLVIYANIRFYHTIEKITSALIINIF